MIFSPESPSPLIVIGSLLKMDVDRATLHLPWLFSIIINDLLRELNSSGIGVKIYENFLVSVLAFADDIVLLAENAEDLQKLINIVHQWSSKWRFIINPEKSQIVHYRNAPKVRTNVEFRLYENGPILQIVDSWGIFR